MALGAARPFSSSAAQAGSESGGVAAAGAARPLSSSAEQAGSGSCSACGNIRLVTQ